MYKKILVAFDNDEKSKNAIKAATEIAKYSKGEICLLTSVKLTSFVSAASPDMIKELEDESSKLFAGILKEHEDKIKKKGIKVSSVILNESPGRAITNYAEEEGFDLIVIGSANRGIVGRVFRGLGSVSNYVVQHATCNVLLIKN